MRRTDRLFSLVQIVRDGRVHLARDLADRLEVSVRTIYRDMDTLAASGVPIEGERGIGYALRGRIDLPALAFSSREREALDLALALLSRVGDAALRDASTSLGAKLDGAEAATTDGARAMAVHGIGGPGGVRGVEHLAPLRDAVRRRCRVDLGYATGDGARTRRTVRPLELEFWGTVWTLTSWCERREDFRVFRLDRIRTLRVTGDRFDDEPPRTLGDYLRGLADEAVRP